MKLINGMATLGLTLVTIGCGAPIVTPVTPVVVDDGCQAQLDTMTSERAKVDAGLDYALLAAKVDVDAQRLKTVKTGFDALQKDYDVATMRLCKDRATGRIGEAAYLQRRDCLDASLTKMRLLSSMMKSDAENASEKAWVGEAQLADLVSSVTCTATGSAPQVLTPPPSSGTTNGGLISLESQLVCQRKQPDGSYVDVPDCNRAELKENDRFKIGFKTDKPARVYLMLHNNKGQFQMLFPGEGIDNEAIPHTQYYLPQDDWFELDDVSGVMEIIQMVASTYKLPELEAQRGADVAPPAPGKKKSKAILATRGIIEPVIYRGVKLGGKKGRKAKQVKLKPTSVKSGSSVAQTIPTLTSRPDVVGAEYFINHIK